MNVDVERLLKRLGIEAKKKGKEWVAKCPNPAHDDHSPSWRMRDEPGATRHGYHKCWPCGFGGTAVDLVQKVLGIEDWREAKRWIEDAAAPAAKQVEAVEVRVSPARRGFRLPAEVMIEPIEKWPAVAREYFVGERGLEPWQVERWGVGYAVEGRLRGRIVIVSRDAQGRPKRYTARSFTGAERRYLEPEVHERASESAMFGEQHWPDPRGSEPRDVLFVVEGAINGLALEAELPGIYFGATAGSQMRGLYGPKLATWKRLCVMTDPDDAGDKLHAEIAASVARSCEVERLRLEPGMDQAKLRTLHPGRLGAIVRAWLRR